MMKTLRRVLVALITASFLVTGVSGLVLAFPGRLLPLLGASLLTWRSIHDWSALAFAVTVAAHLALNRRRIVELFFTREASGAPEAVAVPSTVRSAVRERPEEMADEAAYVQYRQRLNRRRFLLVAGGAATALAAAVFFGRGRSHHSGSQTVDPLAGFPVLNIESDPPAVSAADWQLTVDGLVTTSLQLDHAAWLALPHTAETRDFHCVEGWSVDKLGWSGVSVAELLRRAAPQAQGQFVTFHAYGGGYSDSLTLAEAQAPDTLLADSVDGKPLPAAHGGPLRLVIPTQLGYKNVKWVVRLEVTANRAKGYWETNGDYPSEARV